MSFLDFVPGTSIVAAALSIWIQCERGWWKVWRSTGFCGSDLSKNPHGGLERLATPIPSKQLGGADGEILTALSEAVAQVMTLRQSRSLENCEPLKTGQSWSRSKRLGSGTTPTGQDAGPPLFPGLECNSARAASLWPTIETQ